MTIKSCQIYIDTNYTLTGYRLFGGRSEYYCNSDLGISDKLIEEIVCQLVHNTTNNVYHCVVKFDYLLDTIDCITVYLTAKVTDSTINLPYKQLIEAVVNLLKDNRAYSVMSDYLYYSNKQNSSVKSWKQLEPLDLLVFSYE